MYAKIADSHLPASRFYAELEESHHLLPHYREAYRLLNRTFIRFLNEQTDISGVHFSGAFSQVDYLLKRHHARQAMQQSVNEARLRLRNHGVIGEEELQRSFLYDLKAVAKLIALVSGEQLPRSIAELLPKDILRKATKVKTFYLRIIVNHFDDTFIYANADSHDNKELKVFYAGQSPHAAYTEWDWSYLKDMLLEGSQLNIIRPREHEGVLYPELFILEPDYLVDISSVANCYESYGASPVNHLLAQLKPQTPTGPIILGNLAGQLLDEGLYLYPHDCPYKESARRFFKTHAMSLLTTPTGRDFHVEAQNQKNIIRHTLHDKLPALFGGNGMDFNTRDVMVEPSFFSEMLGLQGRMDFLQLGHRVLIEQKSGKGRFPDSNPPKPQDKHYLQLLLYMLLLRYNYNATYQRNNRELHAFLLYSKYTEGLLPLSFAPDLVFAAIKLRNGIAADEYAYSSSGLGMLATLTAGSLNSNNAGGTLWERFQRPQIEQLLEPIHQASETERAYYLRFLRFLHTEHLLAKIGNQTKDNSGFADKWHSSLDDKLLAGNIYCDLELLSPTASEQQKVEQIVMGFTEKPEHDISNFRVGDIVIFYPYSAGEEPDVRKTMVFRATIEEIGSHEIVLRLRAPQANSRVFWYQGERRWAIEHDFFDSSFGSLYRGMHAFLSAPKQRRDLLMMKREPETDRAIELKGDYGAFNQLVSRARQAKDLFLIIGPPGTGKTSFGLLNTLKEELAATTGSVLLLSYTNRAVDEICSKLTESGIDYIRIGGRFSCEEAYRPHLIDSVIDRCNGVEQLREVVCKTRVFTGTTTAFNSHINLFQLKQFSLAIIDEASQILEPHLLGLLSATGPDGQCAIRKMILIGDHKQLPAVVQQSEEESMVDEPLLLSVGLSNCRLSLFERLLNRYRHRPDITYMLTRQGRMHSEIADFPNKAFYGSQLQVVPLPHQQRALPTAEPDGSVVDKALLCRRIAFIGVEPAPHTPSDKVNTNEALLIAKLTMRIYQTEKEHFDALQTVGIIVPYRNQIAEVRAAIACLDINDLKAITIDTVERFQGSQRDYIIYGFTVQKYYQLNFLANNVFAEDDCLIDRKLNVAMTRAREHLVMVGNPKLLADNTTFLSLLDYLKAKDSYFEASE